MSVSRDVRNLLGDLRRAGSPVERMRLLARAWRTVRTLTPTERKVIASQLGMKEVEDVLAKLGRADDGIAPAELLTLLEKADYVRPSQLRELMRGLRDRNRRKEILARGLDFLQERLTEREEEGEEPDDESSAEKATERSLSSEELAKLRPVPVAAAFPPEPEPGPADESAAEPGTTSVETTEDDRTEAPEIAEEPEPEPEPAPEEVRDEPRERAEPIREPEPKAAVARPPAVAPAPRVVPAPEPPPPDRPAGEAIGLVEELRSTFSLVRRFRRLRDFLAGGAQRAPKNLRAVIDAFPEGWARRRAVMALFRAGLPGTIGEALSIIDSLGDPGSRWWCAAALIDSRVLSDRDAERLATRLSHPSLLRRLQR